jgi:hypothetical protein
MLLKIVPFAAEWEPAVRRFNERLQAHAADFQQRWGRPLSVGLQFPERAESPWLPKRPDREVFEEYWLAIDAGEARGGYVVKRQPYMIEGAVRECGVMRLPISEGIIDPAYNAVAMILMKDMLQRYPLVFTFAGSGWDQPVTRWLSRLKWPTTTVPYYIKVLHAQRFFRLARILRRKPWMAWMMDAAAWTGAGYAAVQLAQMRPWASKVDLSSTDVEVMERFDGKEDELWESCANTYRMIGLRTHNILNILYPEQVKEFRRLRVRRHGKLLGWAVVIVQPFQGDKFYGDLRVGIITDCLAPRENARIVTAHALHLLESEGADIVISHQSHDSWGAALRSLGFVPYKSRHFLALAPGLASHMTPLEAAVRSSHFTKGDGDGPTNLISGGLSQFSSDRAPTEGWSGTVPLSRDQRDILYP